MAHQIANGVGINATDESSQLLSKWAAKYRGATVSDLDLPPALSTSASTPVSDALLSASSHDYSYLTVVSDNTRSLLGYLPITRLQSLLSSKQLQHADPVSKAMVKFQRSGRKFQPILMDTPLEALEGFFANVGELSTGLNQDFAVVTDGGLDGRKFVLGVVTQADLDEFVRRRPV